MLPSPRPTPATRTATFSSPLNTFVGAGITVLTMTSCDTVEGILSLVRQGKGGMANKHADKLWKKLKKDMR